MSKHAPRGSPTDVYEQLIHQLNVLSVGDTQRRCCYVLDKWLYLFTISPAESNLKDTLAPIHTLSPGFRATLISRCFIGTENTDDLLTRCVWAFGSFVPSRERVPVKRGSSTELVILVSLAFVRFSTEAYTSTLRCCSGRILGYTK